MIEIIGQLVTVQLNDGSTFVGRLDAISDDSITISGTRISQSMLVADEPDQAGELCWAHGCMLAASHDGDHGHTQSEIDDPGYCRGCGHFHIGLTNDCPDAPCGSYLCCIN